MKQPFDIIAANQKKAEKQREVAELSRQEQNLLITWATGCGKGKCCMQVLDKDISGHKWLIVVPEILQIENLKADIVKHNMEHLYEMIEDIICYASFNKYKGWEGNLWFNEVHKLSNLRTNIADMIKYHRILADSATVPDIVRLRLSSLCKFKEHTITLSQAIHSGILPEPEVHIVNTDLDEETEAYLDKIERQIEIYQLKLEQGDKWARNKLNQLGSHRKRILGESKTPELISLVQKLKNKRTIIFTASIDQCDEVGGIWAIHSKKTKKHNIATLEAFNNGEIEKIFVQKMGREGLNLEQIEAVIITQLGTGNDDGLEFIQILGRGLRSLLPEIYILCSSNKKDRQNLTNALYNIDSKFIQNEKNQKTSSQGKKTIGGPKKTFS